MLQRGPCPQWKCPWLPFEVISGGSTEDSFIDGSISSRIRGDGIKGVLTFFAGAWEVGLGSSIWRTVNGQRIIILFYNLLLLL